MAMSTGGEGLNSEPNVIPMIDILLVLLIIFMMTITQQRKAMDVQIPAEQQVEREQSQAQSDQIVLELRNDGSYAINNTPLDFSQLDASMHALYDQRPAKILFVKTARNRIYRDIITVMDIARGAGVQVIGFTPPDKAEAGADN